MTSITNIKIGKSDGKARLAQDLESAFPDVDPGETPLGQLVLLQVKQPANKTTGGILLSDHDIATEFDNTQVAKVIGLGKLAYHTRDTMKPWPEGAWVVVGDYVRISQHNGKRWTVPMPGTRGVSTGDRVTFVLIDDHHIASVVHDPLSVRAFF